MHLLFQRSAEAIPFLYLSFCWILNLQKCCWHQVVTIIDPLSPSETCSPHPSPQLPSAQGGKSKESEKDFQIRWWTLTLCPRGGKVRSPKKVLRSGGGTLTIFQRRKSKESKKGFSGQVGGTLTLSPGGKVRSPKVWEHWLSGQMGPLTIRFYSLLVRPAWGAAAGQARYKCTNIQLLETNQNVDGISNSLTLQISRYSFIQLSSNFCRGRTCPKALLLQHKPSWDYFR